MICPRCEDPGAGMMVASPVGQEWEVYLCPACNYSWRSTEPADVSDPNHYPLRFKLTGDRIAAMQPYPPIPEVKRWPQ
jgi:hypothetical protein